MTAVRIVLDVWGGEQSMEHIARYLPTIRDCWQIAARELEAGYLINLRQEVAWGGFTPFDSRSGLEAGAGELQ